MQNKLLEVTTRTLTNVFMLGLISAATIFTSNLLIASSQRFTDTVAEDIAGIRYIELPEIKKVA